MAWHSRFLRVIVHSEQRVDLDQVFFSPGYELGRARTYWHELRRLTTVECSAR